MLKMIKIDKKMKNRGTPKNSKRSIQDKASGDAKVYIKRHLRISN